MFAGKLTREERLRLEVMDFYHRQGTKNVRLICRRYGIHHSTFYRWKKRFNPRNLSSLKSKKRGPKVGRTIPWNVVVEVCVWKRQNPGKGAEYLYQLYLAEGKKPPCSQSSMYRWWKRRGLLEVRKKRKRRSLPLVRGVQAPGDLVQVDTKHLPWGRYQYTAIDKFSKKRFLWVYEKLTMASSRDFLERLVKAFPFKIKLIQTDNGPEFQSLFLDALKDHGISHQYTWIHTPDQNGCVERSHRTDEDEFYWQLELKELSLAELNKRIIEWTDYYNQKRLHWALNWKTPEQFLRLYLSQN